MEKIKAIVLKCWDNLKVKGKNRKFWLCLVGVALMIIGPFLPIYTINFLGLSMSVNYIMNDGAIADGIFIILLALAIIILHGFNKGKFSLIPCGIALILLINLYTKIGGQLSSGGIKIGSFGIGYYVMILGTIMSGVASFLIKDDNANKESNSVNSNPLNQ